MGEASRSAQFANNLKQVSLALFNYESAYGRLPPAVVRDGEGRPLYSWRVLILPFLEQDHLYREFHLDEPWDSPHNRALLESGPRTYRGIGPDYDPSMTYIQVFVSPGSAFEDGDGELMTLPDGHSNFPDGLDRTILAVESGRGVPWSAPFDLPCGPGISTWNLGGGFTRDRRAFHSAANVDDFRILFADGSVRSFPSPIAPATIRALITRNGNEPTGAGEP